MGYIHLSQQRDSWPRGNVLSPWQNAPLRQCSPAPIAVLNKASHNAEILGRHCQLPRPIPQNEGSCTLRSVSRGPGTAGTTHEKGRGFQQTLGAELLQALSPDRLRDASKDQEITEMSADCSGAR